MVRYMWNLGNSVHLATDHRKGKWIVLRVGGAVLEISRQIFCLFVVGGGRWWWCTFVLSSVHTSALCRVPSLHTFARIEYRTPLLTCIVNYSTYLLTYLLRYVHWSTIFLVGMLSSCHSVNYLFSSYIGRSIQLSF